ncbi:hypothetical protein [uncultured Aquitalea sp.]|uniref:hypothetical protein n=1 Tax=uncultured Aquitalea sp. TaxID=540272 RepID=UPI0025E5CA99|nr:hypothetical protein [uncultured Aquitalea sp.]
MSPQERATRKQLLLMKGEALRVKLKLELQTLRRSPLGLAGEGLQAAASHSRFGKLTALLGEALPSETLRGWLRKAGRFYLLWQLARKFWPR